MTTENYKFRYDTLTAMLLFTVGAIGALFYFTPALLLVAVVVWMLSHGLGLAVGYHRLLTHRGFTTPVWFEYFITWCGLLTLQGGHIKWVAIHRKHHQDTDRKGDPHSPRDGFWRSHLLWMIQTDDSIHTREFSQKYALDLYRGNFHRFFNKYWWLPSTFLAVIFFFIGGLPLVLWGIFVPVAVGLQFTWLVNSVCHRFGSRMFNTDDDSKNNWWVALLTWGEGWHNNHHAKPTRARHGLVWYQIDPSWIMIRFLSLLGLAKSIKL